MKKIYDDNTYKVKVLRVTGVNRIVGRVDPGFHVETEQELVIDGWYAGPLKVGIEIIVNTKKFYRSDCYHATIIQDADPASVYDNNKYRVEW